MRQVAHVCHTMSSRLDMAKEPMAPGATTRELGEKADGIIACNEKSNPPNFDSASTETDRTNRTLRLRMDDNDILSGVGSTHCDYRGLQMYRRRGLCLENMERVF